MSTLVVYGDAADGRINSSHATVYATARTGSSLSANTTSVNVNVGQISDPQFVCYESFFAWDTSALAGAIVSVATCSLWLVIDLSGALFTARMRLDDWGAALTTADWIAGESFPGAYTLLAHRDTNGIGATGAYKDLVDDAFAANINTAGFTRVVVTSDRFEAGTSPTVDEYVTWSTADTTGTTQDPKLTITYTVPLPPGVQLVGPNSSPSRILP